MGDPERIRRACLVVSFLWWLVALQLFALGYFNGHDSDWLLFATAGSAMWYVAGFLAPWVLA